MKDLIDDKREVVKENNELLQCLNNTELYNHNVEKQTEALKEVREENASIRSQLIEKNHEIDEMATQIKELKENQ